MNNSRKEIAFAGKSNYHMLNFNKVIDTTSIASKLNLLLYLKPMRLRRGLWKYFYLHIIKFVQ